jgi:hypothetical protein
MSTLGRFSKRRHRSSKESLNSYEVEFVLHLFEYWASAQFLQT